VWLASRGAGAISRLSRLLVAHLFDPAAWCPSTVGGP